MKKKLCVKEVKFVVRELMLYLSLQNALFLEAFFSTNFADTTFENLSFLRCLQGNLRVPRAVVWKYIWTFLLLKRLLQFWTASFRLLVVNCETEMSPDCLCDNDPTKTDVFYASSTSVMFSISVLLLCHRRRCRLCGRFYEGFRGFFCGVPHSEIDAPPGFPIWSDDFFLGPSRPRSLDVAGNAKNKTWNPWGSELAPLQLLPPPSTKYRVQSLQAPRNILC